MTEENGNTMPFSLRTPYYIPRTMVGIDDETIHPNSDEMVHGIRYYGATIHVEKRLGAMFSQRMEPCSQSCS